MDQKLNNYGITKLINLYRARPALWNRNSKLYWQRDVKAKCYQEIAIAMGLSKEMVKKKIQNLRSTYTAEKKRIFGRSGTGVQRRAPTLSWYSEMLFLEDSMVHNTSDSSNMSDQNDAITESYDEIDLTSDVEENGIHSPRSTYTNERTKMSAERREPQVKENYSPTLCSTPKIIYIDNPIATAESLDNSNEPELNHQESIENKCGICLEEEIEIDWNEQIYDSNITYKDCYYKFTQLEYDDKFSTMLCRNCSNGLEYIDAFIAKAIKSHEALQQKFDFNMTMECGEDNIKCDVPSYESILVEEADIKPDIENLPIDEEPMEEFISISEAEKAVSLSENRLSPLPQTKEMPIFKEPTKKAEEAICCSICPKVLCSKYNSIKHERTHNKNRERNLSCEECGMKFYSKEILRAHKETHRENRKKHKCEYCDKSFYLKSGLNIHRRIHLGQMIPCTLCTKQYCRQVDLDKHMATHSASKISSELKKRRKCFVPCKNCGENVRSTSFKSHIAKHMSDPLFRCSICDKEFFFRNSGINHLKKTHDKSNEEAKNLIIVYKKNRISHLFMQQYANEQVKWE